MSETATEPMDDMVFDNKTLIENTKQQIDSIQNEINATTGRTDADFVKRDQLKRRIVGLTTTLMELEQTKTGGYKNKNTKTKIKKRRKTKTKTKKRRKTKTKSRK